MTHPYLIGIDCGTQSAKVAVYDATARSSRRARQALQPMSRPRHGVAVHPGEDVWDCVAAASRAARACAAAPARSPPPASAGSAAARPSSGRTAPSWSRSSAGWTIAPTSRTGPRAPMSGTRRPAPATSPTASPARSGTRPRTTSSCSGRSTPIPGSGATMPRCTTRSASPGRRSLELQLPGDVVGPATAEASAATRHPRRDAGRPDRERQGRGGARRGLRWASRPRSSRSAPTSPRWCPAARTTGRRPLLDEFRLRPAPLPLREPRHPARDVDADVVPRPARRRGRRAGGVARACRASATSSRRPRRPLPEATG